jgi:chromosome segregation ATPase
VTSGEPRDSRDQVVRWLEDGQRQMSALLGIVHENERLRERLEAAESESEKLREQAYELEQVRNRAETAERQLERARGQLGEAQAEIERHNREREEVAERLTELMNQVLIRLRPQSKVAEAA